VEKLALKGEGVLENMALVAEEHEGKTVIQVVQAGKAGKGPPSAYRRQKYTRLMERPG